MINWFTIFSRIPAVIISFSKRRSVIVFFGAPTVTQHKLDSYFIQVFLSIITALM